MARETAQQLFQEEFRRALEYKRPQMVHLRTKIKCLSDAWRRAPTTAAKHRYRLRLRELRLKLQALYQECVKRGRQVVLEYTWTRHPTREMLLTFDFDSTWFD